MAGSYRHIRDPETGHFRTDEIENLRDAREALEECFFLIDRLSGGQHALVEALVQEMYRGQRGEPVDADTRAALAKLRRGA